MIGQTGPRSLNLTYLFGLLSIHTLTIFKAKQTTEDG